ncbi:MAG: hypothetical protein JXQ71_10090 [Verrucomicrobia bacterium]|nr:hypothetical protein [Verrucomicrobiota bacterium]
MFHVSKRTVYRLKSSFGQSFLHHSRPVPPGAVPAREPWRRPQTRRAAQAVRIAGDAARKAVRADDPPP